MMPAISQRHTANLVDTRGTQRTHHLQNLSYGCVGAPCPYIFRGLDLSDATQRTIMDPWSEAGSGDIYGSARNIDPMLADQHTQFQEG